MSQLAPPEHAPGAPQAPARAAAAGPARQDHRAALRGLPYAEQAAALSPRSAPGWAEPWPGVGPDGGLGGPPAPGVDVPAAGRPLLRWGSKGDDVRECQRKLNLHGAELVEDGDFGAKTHSAVCRFQGDRGLSVDGVVGPITWGALDEGLAARPPGEDTPIPDAVRGTGATPARLVSGHDTNRNRLAGDAGAGERELDDASLVGKLLMADRSEFSGYMSSGVLSPVLASVLALMRDLGGDTQYSYEIAKNGLSDGTLLGLVYNAERDRLLQRKLSPRDPDRADFATLQATSKGAVFGENQAGTRGLVLVGDGHSSGTRSLILDLSHELNHFQNRSASKAIAADASKDLADGVPGITPAQVAETRRMYVDEVCARHVEWWGAWTVRMERLGGKVTDVDPPAPDALFAACVELAVGFQSDPIYDPHGYWQALVNRGDDSVERQVGRWLGFVPLQTLSGNPYRDMQSKAAFAAAATRTVASATPDGLGGDV